jgi:DNA-binding GntR family transcriptional regulator
MPLSDPSPPDIAAGVGDLAPIDHANLGDAVYATLCDSLIKGRFKPDDRLKIRDIAHQLHTSVTPVRDAILRLIQDEALVPRSPRDIRVPILDAATYIEIRDIRANLEGLAGEKAASLASPEDIAAVEEILRHNEAAIAARDFTRATELNQIFHFKVAAIAGMPVLQGILRRLWLQMGPVIAEIYETGGRGMIEHHYRLLDALRERDAAAAGAAMRDDILLGGRVILDRVEARRQTL